MSFHCLALIAYQILTIPIKTMILFQQPNGMIQLSQKHLGLGYLERYPSHMIQLVGRVSFVDLANIQNYHVLHLLCWFFN